MASTYRCFLTLLSVAGLDLVRELSFDKESTSFYAIFMAYLIVVEADNNAVTIPLQAHDIEPFRDD